MARPRTSRSHPTAPPPGKVASDTVPPRTKRPTKAAVRAPALNADTLAQLGAPRLAELLMSYAEADPALARSLRLVVAETGGAGHLAAEVEKRLRTIRRSKGFVEWDKVRPLARELDALRETITGSLAAASPRDAVAQIRLFLDLAGGVFERSDDSSGALGTVFREAGADLGRLWMALPDRDSHTLAREVLALWDADGYGVTDGLLDAASPALDPEGRAELKRLLQDRLAALPPEAARGELRGWRGRGEISWRLGQLADLDGDVDAYIAAAEQGGSAENHAGDIAERLLARGRAEETLTWLDRGGAGRHAGEELRYAELRVAALAALGRADEAQALRWSVFERWLSAEHLRAYLRGLPDFDDVEAEERAIAYALAHESRDQALAFLVAWPNLEAANRLVRAHHKELDGRDYGRLRPAADALVERYPAAASLLHRRLAEDVLQRAASRYYQYAARDVLAAAALAPLLLDENGLESHAAFMARLRREHPRKAAFWSLLGESDER